MSVSRRGFIKRAGATGVAILASSWKSWWGFLAGNVFADEKATRPTPVLTPDGKLMQAEGATMRPFVSSPPPASEVRRGIPGKQFVMVIDLAKCDGCRKCTYACQAMHFTPPPREWIKVYQMQESPKTAPYWFPKPCFQCDNPPCTKVCPVDATFKRQDGVVLIDNERCIGCRFCMAACPYSARFFNWGEPSHTPEELTIPYSPEYGFPRRKGTVEKCDFCPHLAREGKLPACAAVCPMGAIYFGDQNEDAVTNGQGETLRFSELLLDRAGYQYLEELGTKPRVYYLSPKNRRFPAPGAPQGRTHAS